MADILNDYRIWAAQQEERISTHSDRCHMWRRHEACMIHRLAAALDAARLTDTEREAIKVAASDYSDNAMDGDCWHLSATLRGLLERHCPVPENQLRDNAHQTHCIPDEGSMRHEWIDASERLPEEYETVLVATHGSVSAGEIRFPYSDCGKTEPWWMVFKDRRDPSPSWAGLVEFAGVTHWMPLPEPPEVK